VRAPPHRRISSASSIIVTTSSIASARPSPFLMGPITVSALLSFVLVAFLSSLPARLFHALGWRHCSPCHPLSSNTQCALLLRLSKACPAATFAATGNLSLFLCYFFRLRWPRQLCLSCIYSACTGPLHSPLSPWLLCPSGPQTHLPLRSAPCPYSVQPFCYFCCSSLISHLHGA
jgi:hypothetical protein